MIKTGFQYVGNIGNCILQYFISLRLEQHLGQLDLVTHNDYVWNTISGWELPISFEPQSLINPYSIRRDFTTISQKASAFLISGCNSISIETCSIGFDEFPEISCGRSSIPRFSIPDYLLPNDEEILINIRGGNILAGIHRDYVTPPASYYKHVINKSGKKPYFFGQIGNDAYSDHLRNSFPLARFERGMSPSIDFEILRRAKFLVVAPSTFSLIATWLSEAEQIFFPVIGGFNPFQRPDSSNLPFDDPRYDFTLFPYFLMEKIENALPRLEKGLSGFEDVTHSALKDRISGTETTSPTIDQALKVFDSSFYENNYSDVITAVQSGKVKNPTEHYIRRGFRRNRQPCKFDNIFYANSYTDATKLVGHGYYRTLLDHFIIEGFYLGYKPTP